jgi:hypothetical protein
MDLRYLNISTIFYLFFKIFNFFLSSDSNSNPNLDGKSKAFAFQFRIYIPSQTLMTNLKATNKDHLLFTHFGICLLS